MPSLRQAVRRRRIGSIGLKLALLALILLVSGFGYFIWSLPDRQIVLNRNADGIVVLTGGDSRITDALELLAAGRGKRLLISGVYAGTTTGDIARQVVDYNRLGLFGREHGRQCCGDAAVDDQERIPFPDRGHLLLSYAACARGIVAPAAGRCFDPVSGRLGSIARRAVVVQ
jgi:uncharacterized SAM-binding protein YcdF (DUF218 family)